MKSKKRKGIVLTLILLLSLFCIHLFFGLYHLGKAAYVDERLWTYSKQKRIEKYWNNILERDWKNTRPSDKPGITLALVSGPSLLFTTPSSFIHHTIDKDAFSRMLFIMRLPLLLISSLSIFLFYYVIRELFNKKIALLSTVLIGLSPILLGMSRIVNPDTLTWIFIPITLYAYLAYQKTASRKMLYLSGVFLGLGLLTKYIANLLFPFFILLIIVQPLFKQKTRQKIRTYLRQSFLDLGLITFLSLVTFTLLYPGVWVVPNRLLKGTILSQPFAPIWQYFVGVLLLIYIDLFFNKSKVLTWLIQQLYKIRFIIINSLPVIFLILLCGMLYYTYAPVQSIDFQTILFSPKTSLKHIGSLSIWQGLITSFYIPMFSTNILVLFGVFASIFLIFQESLKIKKTSSFSSNIYTLWSLMLFILIFYSSSIFNKILPVMRYQIILFPIFLTITEVGWYYLPKHLSKKLKSKLQSNFKIRDGLAVYLFAIITVILLTGALHSLKPFYFSYNNFMLPKKHLVNPKDMGDGSYEAAQYLNNLPNAENLVIWSDRRGVCSFFVGKKCNRFVKKTEFLRDGPYYDYFVISKSREKKVTKMSRYYQQAGPTYPLKLDRLYSSDEIVFEVNPGNRPENYIRVLPGDKVPVWEENN
jgi:4-amino-4-deoxy-L-arabinose transferase-like glycosyltransferase